MGPSTPSLESKVPIGTRAIKDAYRERSGFKKSDGRVQEALVQMADNDRMVQRVGTRIVNGRHQMHYAAIVKFTGKE